MVNTAKVKIPEGYHVPEHVIKGRAKDFAMAYWLTKEIGVVAMYIFDLLMGLTIVHRPNFIRKTIVSWHTIGYDLQCVKYVPSSS